MTTTLTWLGHGGWSIASGGAAILLDPFLTDSPVAQAKADEIAADFILVSHGHFDHIADVAGIAQRTGAKVIAAYEVASWLEQQHQVKDTLGMNLGGGVEMPFGRVEMTIAHHSSQLPDGSYGGNPAGFVLTLEGRKVYFACDTALFGDMQLIGARGLDLAVLPIGDLFTMGPADSIEAIRLLRPKRVAPAHYNTWPPIEQDASAWAEQVRTQTSAEPLVLAVGDTIDL
ncbi:metal-dependent hydrolase [Lignipirellula cremea]|uniref:UPF0173 metal-dependent hydrolase Pla8534_29620 n=1 Tax=Lignipirellula cremea TaxID=2528010 RepID=A0A518DTI6_9BACT|nr:metal-dependent hydrolase [Lignipirellula cremea]QDU95150.1 metal-dependent hydrolase [Lignipirellula cremea]